MRQRHVPVRALMHNIQYDGKLCQLKQSYRHPGGVHPPWTCNLYYTYLFTYTSPIKISQTPREQDERCFRENESVLQRASRFARCRAIALGRSKTRIHYCNVLRMWICLLGRICFRFCVIYAFFYIKEYLV